jgi:CBS domain-containing protein
MSPRAAWRLESLGFEQVFDYMGGKADWLAAGLPSEGTRAGTARAGNLSRRDVPTCGLGEPVEAVRERVRAAGWADCAVLNEQGVMLGRLGQTALAASGGQTAEEAMEPGPSTFRPNVPAEELLQFMREHGLSRAWITTSARRLVGLLRREDAERAAEKASHGGGRPGSQG